MKTRKTPRSKSGKADAPRKPNRTGQKDELSDQELDRVAGGVVKFRAGKALKDAVK